MAYSLICANLLHTSTLKAYAFSDLFGIHQQEETVVDATGEIWIGIEKVFNLPTVDLKDE